MEMGLESGADQHHVAVPAGRIGCADARENISAMATSITSASATTAVATAASATTAVATSASATTAVATSASATCVSLADTNYE